MAFNLIGGENSIYTTRNGLIVLFIIFVIMIILLIIYYEKIKNYVNAQIIK